MKNFKFIIVTFAMIAIMASCSDENDVILLEKETFAPEMEITDSVKVNQTEINNIVEDVLSRPQSRQSDYTIETITDDNGKELIYVVNYSNNTGFVVISATKNYYPVLAYNETGNFNISEEMPGGVKLWKNKIESNILKSADFAIEEVKKYRSMWKRFESRSASTGKKQSRNTEETPDWYLDAQTIMMNKKSEFMSKSGCEVYDITGSITGDAALDEEIREYAQNYIYPEYEDYWDVLSFVVRDGNPDEYTNIPNLLQSTWGQGSKSQVPGTIYYNTGFQSVDGGIAYVGCGTVALGQVMRFFEYPNSFNWSNMSLTTPTTTTAAFLYQLAEDCNSIYTSDGTYTYQTDCLNTLKKYGYTGNIDNYSETKIFENLLDDKPVMMRANPVNTTLGHAWVITGGRHMIYDDRYELWTFNTSTNFRCAQEYPDNYYIYTYLYMNWGWDGLYNGLYNTDGLYIPGYSGSLQNKTCIYDITPGAN